jgi:hypothetical protein
LGKHVNSMSRTPVVVAAGMVNRKGGPAYFVPFSGAFD